MTYEPRHEVSNSVLCATSNSSNQPVHTRSLLRAFAFHFLWVLIYQLNIKEKALFTLHVTTELHIFFTSEQPKQYHAWSWQNVCDALTFWFDNNFIRFGTKLHKQVVGIIMGTKCAPQVANVCFFFVMKGTLCCLFLMIIWLILLTL